MDSPNFSSGIYILTVSIKFNRVKVQTSCNVSNTWQPLIPFAKARRMFVRHSEGKADVEWSGVWMWWPILISWVHQIIFNRNTTTNRAWWNGQQINFAGNAVNVHVFFQWFTAIKRSSCISWWNVWYKLVFDERSCIANNKNFKTCLQCSYNFFEKVFLLATVDELTPLWFSCMYDVCVRTPHVVDKFFATVRPFFKVCIHKKSSGCSLVHIFQHVPSLKWFCYFECCFWFKLSWQSLHFIRHNDIPISWVSFCYRFHLHNHNATLWCHVPIKFFVLSVTKIHSFFVMQYIYDAKEAQICK